jgi:hypothetical protein
MALKGPMWQVLVNYNEIYIQVYIPDQDAHITGEGNRAMCAQDQAS